MLRIVSIMLTLALFVALPGGAVAQDNSGLDAYTENPPTPGGDGDTGTSGSAGGGDAGVPGTAGADGTASGVAGAAGADTNSDGIVSEREAAAAGTSPSGQLPATGLDETALMAAVGGLLLALGFGLMRASRQPA